MKKKLKEFVRHYILTWKYSSIDQKWNFYSHLENVERLKRETQ